MGLSINLNTADCLRTVTNVGHFDVYSVCTGSVVYVPWGADNWAACVLLALMGIVLCGFASVLIYFAVRA